MTFNTKKSAADALSGTLNAIDLLRFSLDIVALTIVVLHLVRIPRFRLNPTSVFLVYVLFGVSSTLWSAGPVNTLGKSTELLAAVLVVWITLARADAGFRLERLVDWTLVEIGLDFFYLVLGRIVDPTEFREEALPGALFTSSWALRDSRPTVSRYAAPWLACSFSPRP
jgi:hypothetical protein